MLNLGWWGGGGVGVGESNLPPPTSKQTPKNPTQLGLKYRGSAHRDCNINLKLNYKIPVVFHNLENYDSHLIMQELGKFNLEINFISNGLKKFMSLTINF